jgi:hypothetical protein
MKSKKISGSIYYKTIKKLRPLTISFYNSYTVSSLGRGETSEARDFGSYPESFSLLAGLLALPVFANLPIPKI